MRWRHGGTAAFALVLLFGPVGAWATSQQPQFKAGVDLVQIDVVALDKDGHPIRGLTAADFTLLDRKKPQPIATFKEVTIPSADAAGTAVPLLNDAHEPLKMDVASNQVPPADRLMVMVFDDLHTFYGLSDRVKDIAHKVATALAPQSSIAALFTSGHHNVEFTRDAADVFEAIDTFTGASRMRRPTPGSDAGPMEPKRGSSIPSYMEERDGQLFFTDQTLLKTIGDAGRMLLATPSTRRAFVLFSEGTANDLRGMFQGPETPCDAARRKSCFYQDSLLEAMKNLERANITLYIFDPRGAVDDDDIPFQCLPGVLGPPRHDPCVGETLDMPDGWLRHAQQGLDITAAAAGGFAVTNSDDFDGGITRLLNEIDHYYLLGFSPEDRQGGGFRPVEVRANRPGLTLHYRQGYVLDPPEKKPGQVDPLVAMSSDILPKTDLPLRLTVVPVASVPGSSPGKGSTRILAILDAALPTHTDIGELKYTLLAANLDTGKVAASVSHTATLPPNSAAMSGGVPNWHLDLPIELSLPPGRYQLRASALSAGIEKGGSVYLITTVPAFPPSVLALGGPMLGSVRATPAVLSQGSSVPALPFTPTLDRTFERDDSVRVFCPVINPPSITYQVSLQILDTTGKARVSTLSARLAGDGQPIDATLSLKDLAPGMYRLQLIAQNANQVARREVPILIK
jgi:VWFA-related protein